MAVGNDERHHDRPGQMLAIGAGYACRGVYAVLAAETV
jgi:hypothetical protein